MRKPLIAGNWKMFLTVADAVKLVEGITSSNIDYSMADVLVAPSFTSIYAVSEAVKKSGKAVGVAAQNFYIEDEGAFTGEVSLPMIKSCGASTVILGHSERRNIFGETDAFINAKLHKALSAGLMAVLCVGELLAEREAGVETEVVLSQLGKSLAGVKDLSNVVIAYEPVWAIGTGKTASAADAQQMHEAIRAFIAKIYGQSAADNVRILYGGSVRPDNITELIKEKDVDGALVGGASLKAEQFTAIIEGSRR